MTVEEDEEQPILPHDHQMETYVQQSIDELRTLPQHFTNDGFVAVERDTFTYSDYGSRYAEAILFRAELTRSVRSVRLVATHNHIQGRSRRDGRIIHGIEPRSTAISFTVRLTTLRDPSRFRAALRRNDLPLHRNVIYNPFQAGA